MTQTDREEWTDSDRAGSKHTAVCHVSTTFNRGSGFGRRTLAIAEHCERRGICTHLLFGPDHDMHDYQGPVSWEVVPTLVKPVRPWSDFLAYRFLSNALEAHRPTIVHTHLAKAGILGRLAAARSESGCGAILHTVHGPTFDESIALPKRLLFRQLERVAARRTDIQIHVGHSLLNTYAAAGAAARGTDEVIRTGKSYLGPDLVTASRRPAATENAPLRLIYVARLVPMKQHLHALELTRRLNDSGLVTTLDLVGSALVEKEKAYAGELKRRVAELGMQDRVLFHGHVEDVPDRLALSDLALLVSCYEGLPNGVVESLLANTPIVAYELPGAVEVLGSDLLELSVAKNSVDGLVDTVRWTLNNWDVVAEKIAKRRSELREAYSMKTMLDAKVVLYERLLDRHAGRRHA